MKKQIRGLIKNKTPFALAVKVIIIIGVSYLLIQLSNKEKSIEETKYIPGMQNQYDYAMKYINKKYISNWKRLGHDVYKADRFADYDNLELSVEIGVLNVYKIEYSFTSADFLINRLCKKDGKTYNVEIVYGINPKIEIGCREEDEYISYDILYEGGKFVRNQEMEEYFQITTDEVVEWAEYSKYAFEAELQKMHELQLEKVRIRRKNLTNVGFILLVLYMFLKWGSIMIEHAKEDKPIKQCLDEAKVNTVKKFSRWKYVLYGAAIMFWVYILRPVVSGLILSGVERKVNIYLSYGISAIIVAAAGCFIIMRNNSEKSEKGAGPTLIWLTIQTAAGCILEMFIIRLGMMLVSDFYPRTIRFYIVNGVLWSGAVLLIFVFCKIKYLILKKGKIESL